MNGVGQPGHPVTETNPSPTIRPIQWQNLADRLSLDHVSVNLTGDNPADVTLTLPTMTIKAFGKTAETFSAMVYERDGSPRWPSDSDLRTLRQAVSDKLHSRPAASPGSVGDGLDLTLRVVDQMIRNQTHGVPDRLDDRVSMPAQPKQKTSLIQKLFDH